MATEIKIFRAIYMAPQPGEEWADEYKDIEELSLASVADVIQELSLAVEHDDARFGGDTNVYWNYFPSHGEAVEWLADW